MKCGIKGCFRKARSNRAFESGPPSAAAQLIRRTSTMKCLYALALFLVASCSTVQPSVDVKADLSCRKEKECSCQRPKYPRDSARNREQGLVRLKILVSHEGRTRDVVVERSSGYRSSMRLQWRTGRESASGPPL